MKFEPAVDRALLLETIHAAYRLPIEALDFVPIGFAAVCYHARSVDGTLFFIKLWPDTRPGSVGAVERNTMLRLTRALYDRGLYTRVPHPLPARNGSLWVPFARGSFAVFPFLPGHTPVEWSAALLDEYARAFATIHAATAALADVLPPRETFDLPFEVDLLNSLDVVASLASDVRPGLRALRALLLPRREEILAQLARLHRLQATVRRLDGPFVLCHTDLGGDNLLADDDGKLYLLDWDGATVAPPEHDLHEARWVGLERVLRTYHAAGGARPLQLDHFAFYLLRRSLSDMTARLLRMLGENTTDEQDEDLLAGVETWGFAQWSRLDETLDAIADALGQRAS